MKLRRNEFCPIHRSAFCRGRESGRNERRVIRLGVRLLLSSVFNDSSSHFRIDESKRHLRPPSHI
jgi:hypothetical protein